MDRHYRNCLLTQALYSIDFRVYLIYFSSNLRTLQGKVCHERQIFILLYDTYEKPAPQLKKNGFCGSQNWLPGSEIATGSTSSTLGKSSNRSHGNFNISAKLSNIRKLFLFQRKVLYIRCNFSNNHCDPSINPVAAANKRWVPLFCKIAPNHAIHMT